MSLILEALKKLEREKQAGEPGFVVLSHLPWAAGRSRGAWAAWSAAGLLAVAAVGAAFWHWPRPRVAPAAEAPAAASPPSTAPAGSRLAAVPSTTSASAGPGRPADVETGVGEPPVVPQRPFARPAETAPAAAASPADAAHPRTAPEGGPPAAPSIEGASAGAAPVATIPAPTPTPGVELRLNAISVRDGLPVAILNDRLVREGDIFDGIRVLRIGEAEVEVEVAGERRTLRF